MTKQRTALITGVLGQDGSYLAALLLEKGYKVYGSVHRIGGNLENHRYLKINTRIEYVVCDLQNEQDIIKLIQQIKPDECYHLGGLSAPRESWNVPVQYTQTNVLGIIYLLEAIRLFSPKTRLFNAATSEMFGIGHTNGLQTEDTIFLPTNPYAVTKIYGYWMANVYKKSYRLFIANGIFFSHESPLRGLEFVTRKITSGVAKIKLGLDTKITLGNIESRRDWGFAGDYVKAAWLMLQHHEPDNFVLSTGEVHSIREFIALAFQTVGIMDWEKYIQTDPALYRPIDLNNLFGSSDKAKQLLHWVPETRFQQLVEMMVQADIQRLSTKIS